MHVVVLGAGVIGVTTAYYLSERGHSVTVVDRADAVASGASGGNGGQLSYSFTDAMASPSLLSKLPGIMAGRNPAFCVRPRLNAQLVRWGLAFLGQCRRDRFRHNSVEILKLSLRSGELVPDLQATTDLEFSWRRAGKLVMLDSPESMVEAQQMCELKRQHGCEIEVITLDEAMDIEPALKHMDNGYAGAVYSSHDEVGNSQRFTEDLAQWLAVNRGVQFLLGRDTTRIVAAGGKLKAVETDLGTLAADAVVVSMGAWSSQLLRPLGIKANIYPMRGYSVTLPAIGTSNMTSITDPGSKTVFSRLGDEVRIAGFADFIGYRSDMDEERARKLLDTARCTAPRIADFDAEHVAEWGGFRPMTPDSRPLLGPSKVAGVHLNTGHGMLGWTLACASAERVAAGI
jgi:D-amino-acid dehydrogenase